MSHTTCKMCSIYIRLVLFQLCAFGVNVQCVVNDEPKPCYNRFEYEYNVLEKLIILSEKLASQEEKIQTLTEQLSDAQATIKSLNQTMLNKEKAASGTTYVRWGRTVCPDGATVVYDGYATGNHYSHSGSGANNLCLPKDPIWGDYIDAFQSADRLYGSEYETSSYDKFKHIHDHDVPCVVCRIPRNNVLMVPGRNVCHDDYMLEYNGYIMSGHYSHAGASEYVCVDAEPETVEGGGAGTDGHLFYRVEAACHALKCPPYVNGREVTCAVCSYSPNTQNRR